MGLIIGASLSASVLNYFPAVASICGGFSIVTYSTDCSYDESPSGRSKMLLVYPASTNLCSEGSPEAAGEMPLSVLISPEGLGSLSELSLNELS